MYFCFMKILRLIFVIFLLFQWAFAQKAEKDAINYDKALLIAPTIQVNIPGADFKDRFGLSYQFGLGLDYKIKKNWFLGVEGGFLFGTSVKESEHITKVLTQNGMVITDQGVLDEVNLNMRGASMKFQAGKSFFFKPNKPSSGLLIKMGIGYLQHKILIDVDKKVTPQLVGEYAKGYDRLSNGLLLSQYIGLMRLEKGKYLNVALGFELSEAFTKNARPYDFYLNQKLNQKRVDLMYGIKFTWLIPVYTGKSSSSDYYTY